VELYIYTHIVFVAWDTVTRSNPLRAHYIALSFNPMILKGESECEFVPELN